MAILAIRAAGQLVGFRVVCEFFGGRVMVETVDESDVMPKPHRDKLISLMPSFPMSPHPKLHNQRQL